MKILDNGNLELTGNELAGVIFADYNYFDSEEEGERLKIVKYGEWTSEYDEQVVENVVEFEGKFYMVWATRHGYDEKFYNFYNYQTWSTDKIKTFQFAEAESFEKVETFWRLKRG